MPPETIPKQLSLNVGGATVDVSEIASVKFAAKADVLDGEFKKGSDVEMTIRCRVVGVKVKDEYDAHGNISGTTRQHYLRADELLSAELIDAQAYRQRNEAPSNGGDPEEE